MHHFDTILPQQIIRYMLLNVMFFDTGHLQFGYIVYVHLRKDGIFTVEALNGALSLQVAVLSDVCVVF